jgi:hypothetical protein
VSHREDRAHHQMRSRGELNGCKLTFLASVLFGVSFRYAHYDEDPSFDDWQAFGGWSVPTIKQFDDSPPVCNTSIDYNWYPAY